MRRLFSLVAILAILIASNCSRIPENNDPVIGVWSDIEIKNISATQKQKIRKEWIFNDAYLGRYHSYEGTTLVFKTDFKWQQADGVYTISYPGTNMTSVKVEMIEANEVITLQDVSGNVFAQRE